MIFPRPGTYIQALGVRVGDKGGCVAILFWRMNDFVFGVEIFPGEARNKQDYG